MFPVLGQLGVFGPGLIGGSIALAAHSRGLCRRLVLWSPEAAERQAAAELGIADLVTGDPVEAASSTDLVILCTPPGAMAPLAAALVGHLPPGAIVSDVASVKTTVAGELTAILGERYVGAHPMAGAERQGLHSARANLFEGTVCLLTPGPDADPAAVARVAAFWQELGARVRHLSVDLHDESVALVSHLPHVLAAALMDFVAAEPGQPTDCAGPGWWDMTRIAGGSPELWTEILSRNRGPVTYALRGLMDKLGTVLEVLESGRDDELEAFLARAKTRRGESQRKAGKSSI